MTLKDEFYDGRAGPAVHPWEYPDCPNCEHEIYVGVDIRTNDGGSFVCYKCGEVFRPPDEEIEAVVSTPEERQARSGRKKNGV